MGHLPPAIGHGVVVEMHPAKGFGGKAIAVLALPVDPGHAADGTVHALHVQPMRAGVGDGIAHPVAREVRRRVPIGQKAIMRRGIPTRQSLNLGPGQGAGIDAGPVNLAIEQEGSVMPAHRVIGGGRGELEACRPRRRPRPVAQRFLDPAVTFKRHHGGNPAVPLGHAVDDMQLRLFRARVIAGRDEVPAARHQRDLGADLVHPGAIAHPHRHMTVGINPQPEPFGPFNIPPTQHLLAFRLWKRGKDMGKQGETGQAVQPPLRVISAGETADLSELALDLQAGGQRDIDRFFDISRPFGIFVAMQHAHQMRLYLVAALDRDHEIDRRTSAGAQGVGIAENAGIGHLRLPSGH